MKKTELKGLDITLYSEVLDNGLSIYMLPYSNKKNFIISYATKYGSDVLSFTDSDSEKCVPPLGVAHFLEHKMFEDESGIDQFILFQENGCDCNASTSFDNTQYLCFGNKKFRDNLRNLIKLVNNPYFTDENVLKEKGIIAEEIKMYNDSPDYILETKLRECIYKNSPRKIDIAGTIPEIEKITKKDLYDCYKAFYRPNNMFILAVGNFNVDDCIEVIKDELNDKENLGLVDVDRVREPSKVYKSSYEFTWNVEVSKVGIGLKVNSDDLSMNSIELDLYLNMLTNILFGSSSLFRDRVRNDKLLSGMSMNWESSYGFRTFYFIASSVNPDKLIEEVENEFNNISISDETFERIKKVWIANEVKIIDNIDRAYDNIFDDIINYGKVVSNRIDLIRRMSVNTLNKLIDNIDFNNISVVKMISKEK